MQATLDSTGLKHFIRAVTCLSKFGEDIVVVAALETFAVSSTNNAMTAYGRFKYPRSFFSKYRVDKSQDKVLLSVSGQISTKALLSVLRHKANEKACEKCEFVITDGQSQDIPSNGEDVEEDTLESRLTIRMHCKHGIVKTYRLSLNPANSLSPTIPDPAVESQLTIGPKPLKSLLEHFPFGQGKKSDPQLIWNFWEDEVQLRSLESAIDAKGRPQLATELTISADEFERYDLQTGPMTVAFHLREFNATIAYAEAAGIPLEIRFTDPVEPLYINVDNELSDTIFVIATSQVQSFSRQNSQQDQKGGSITRGKKRPYDDDNDQHNVRVVNNVRREGIRPKKPMKVVHVSDRASIARDMGPLSQPPQPSWAVLAAANSDNQNQEDEDFGQPEDFALAGPSRLDEAIEKEPLFLPSSQLSQLPPSAQAAIIDSGLGIEYMTAEDIEAMLEGDAEEVDFGSRGKEEVAGEDELELEYGDENWDNRVKNVPDDYDLQTDSLELLDDVEMAPTQNYIGTKVFRPLFED